MMKITNEIEKEKYKDKGITMIALVITIVVLGILATITIKAGKDVIKKAKLEELRTNMLLIEAKGKEYVEEASFKMGLNPNEADKTQSEKVYNSKGLIKFNTIDSGTVIPNVIIDDNFYEVTKEALKQMGLEDIKINSEKNEKYLIRFDEQNLDVEVYNTIGFEGVCSLTELENIEF